MCTITRPQRRQSRSPRRVRSAISSATCRQSCAGQHAKRSSANWSSSERLRAYVGREPVSSRWLSSHKGPKPTSLSSPRAIGWPKKRCSWCFPWPATATAGSLRSVNALEHYDRYLPGGLLLILGKNRHLFGVAVEQPLALLASRHRRPDPKAFAAQFDCCFGVGD